jgi:hypothetical protein
MTTMIRPRYYLDSPYYDNETDRLRPGAPSHVRREFNRYRRIETFVPVRRLPDWTDHKGKK